MSLIERLKLVDEKERSALRRFVISAEKVGYPRTIESFLWAQDSIFQSEVENRRYKLAEKLERSKEIKDKFQRKEKKHHERSIQRINKTIKIFKAERKIMKSGNLKKMDDLIKDKETFTKIRENSIEELKNGFLESSEDPDNALEVIEIFSDVLNKVEERGDINGFFDYIEEQLEELKRIRSEEKDRGREKHSPLAFWKVWALNAGLGLAAGIVIWCLATNLPNFWICLEENLAAWSWAFGFIAWVIQWC